MNKNIRDEIHYQQSVDGMGCFSLRSMATADIATVHAWVIQPYAHYWGMQGFTLEQVAEEYQRIAQSAEVFIGLLNDEPVFLMERYHPKDDPVSKHYAVMEGDRGMHILVAPVDKPVSGFTWTVFRVVMDFIFSDPAVSRVVVEPDARNTKIHALNARAGFEFQKLIQLPNKEARLEFCHRDAYQEALRSTEVTSADVKAIDHLSAQRWQQVNRIVLAKAISEFAHELLIQPALIACEDEIEQYQLALGDIVYRFHAQRLSLDHWLIEPASIEKQVNGKEQTPELLSFVIELSDHIEVSPQVLPTYLEELSSTLYGLAYKYQNAPNVATLLTGDFQQLEAAMMEGHPTFVANSGRIGYDIHDYHNYAPEVASPIRLIWLAVHRSRAEFSAIRDLNSVQLLTDELGEMQLQHYRHQLSEKGLNPDDYLLMPVHPWQWQNKLVTVFAADIAQRKIVLLGESQDRYQAQQSLRTFFNISTPQRRYVKTALSILNMGFMRGLSPKYMSSTPAINDWIHHLLSHDRYLASKGFRILREVAAIAYRHHDFHQANLPDTPYRKMLACLWRENPYSLINEGQKPMTMAALLHVDGEGKALLPELIKASGLNTTQWLVRYLDSYFTPLLHCFYAHQLVFMPHGENVILVMEQHVVARVLMKDIGEESAILNPDVLLSEKIQRLAIDVPDEHKVLYLFTDVFDGFFRYLSAILQTQHSYPQSEFWRQVAECVIAYQQAHPEYQEQFCVHDLFMSQYARCCLNRLQLNDNRQMVDLDDPSKKLQFVGVLDNPIAAYRPGKQSIPSPQEDALDA